MSSREIFSVDWSLWLAKRPDCLFTRITPIPAVLSQLVKDSRVLVYECPPGSITDEALGYASLTFRESRYCRARWSRQLWHEMHWLWSRVSDRAKFECVAL